MKILTVADLKPEKGINYSRSHLYRLVAAGRFPRPLRLGVGRIGFIESELDDWLEARAAERDKQAGQ